MTHKKKAKKRRGTKLTIPWPENLPQRFSSYTVVVDAPPEVLATPGQKVSVEVIDDDDFKKLARLWFKERSDLALLAAFELCRDQRVRPPDWLLYEIGTLALNGITDAEIRRLKNNREDLTITSAVHVIKFSDKHADYRPALAREDGTIVQLTPVEMKRRGVFRRAIDLLAKCGIERDESTIRVAVKRTEKGLAEPSGEHQHFVLKWLHRFRVE